MIYGVLAVIEFKLLLTYIQAGLPVIEPAGHEADDDRDAPLAFAY